MRGFTTKTESEETMSRKRAVSGFHSSKFRTLGWKGSVLILVFLGAVLCCSSPARGGDPAQKPKVRAITAFIRIDRANYKAQIANTLEMLHQAKTAFERGGYQVESVRITTQPFPEYVRGLKKEEALAFFRAYGDLAGQEHFAANIGPAMLHDTDDPSAAQLLGEVLSDTKNLNASLVVAGEDGIHWKSIQAAAKLIKFVEMHTPHSQGTFNFTATAMLAPYAPFFPGSYHTGEGHQFSVAWEAANLVDEVFAGTGSNVQLAAERLRKAFAEHALETDTIAREVEKQCGWTYMGLDASSAPSRQVSIGAAIEKFLGAKIGSSGTMTAAALITQAIRSIPVKKIGYSGLMLPVLEDGLLAQRWSEGTYNIDSVLAYSAVCGTGIDTIPLPGDISEAQLARMIGDMATLAVKWHKPLSARLQPVAGKKPGDRTEFTDSSLVNTTIQPLQ